MDYYIETKEETEEEFDFPEGLSYFFEQLGGYGNTSMVSQVERILNIDLSLFQKTYHPDDKYDEDFDDDPDSSRDDDESDDEDYNSDSFWLSVDDIQAVTREFILKIAESPEYHAYVKYEGMLYPEDTGYLSTGEILGDLRELDATISKIKEQKCTEIRLVYAWTLCTDLN